MVNRSGATDGRGRNARAFCIFNAIGIHRVKNIVTRRVIFPRAQETSRRRRTSYMIREIVLHTLERARASIAEIR